MNKIYKVVWNKARNCYVVASEFAKGQTKSAGGNSKRTEMKTMAAAAAVVMGVFVMPLGGTVVFASDKVGDPNPDIPNEQYSNRVELDGNLKGLVNADNNILFVKNGSMGIQLKLADDIVVKTITADTIKKSDGTELGWTAQANGEDVKAKDGKVNFKSGDNINVTTDGDGEMTISASGLAKTEDVAVVYDKNGSLKSTNATSVGNQSISLGKKSQTTGDYNIAIGDGSKVINGSSSVALGNQSEARDAVSTALGAQSSAASWATAVGANSSASAMGSIAIGTSSEVGNAGGIAIGRAAKNTSADNSNQKPGIAIGDFSLAQGEQSFAIGPSAKALGDYSIAFGELAKTETGTKWAAVLGHESTIGKDANWSTIIGSKSSISDGASSSTAVGGYSKISAKWGTALGTSSNVTAENGTALGGTSSVTVKNGVALGVSSIADSAAGKLGYLADTDTTDITWKANAGAVSVGSTTMTRQITNVAAGSKDTDAVNVAQLKKVQETITGDVSKNTFGLSDDSGIAKVTNTLNNTVQVKGANGITSTVKDGALEIGLGNDITVGKEGKDGEAGSIGLVGPAGKDGLTTTTIKTEYGPAGVDGKDGITRIVYETKDGGKHEVATLDDGLNFQGDRGGAIAKKLNETLNIKGNAVGTAELSDGNIGVVGENGGLTVKLNKDLTGLNSVTTHNAYVTNVDGEKDTSVTNVAYVNKQIANSGWWVSAEHDEIGSTASDIKNGGSVYFATDGNGLVISQEALPDADGEYTGKGAQITIGLGNTITIGETGVKIGVQDGGGANPGEGKYITGLTNTKWESGNIVADRAATEGQLQEVSKEAGKHTTLSNGKNTTIEPTVKDGQTDYKVNVAGDLTDITSVANGDAKLALNGAAGTAGIINGQGASVYMQGNTTVINQKVSVDKNGKISGVAAGVADTDAVNVSQLNVVKETANKGWNLSTNGDKEATQVKPGGKVDFSGDKNIKVSNDVTNVKVALNEDVQLNSATFGDTVINTNGLTIGSGTSGLEFSKNRVSVGGQQIHDVAAGTDDMDAVNVSQLNKVKETADKGWNLSTNGKEATQVKPGDTVDFSGDDNISVSNDGTKVTMNLNKDLTGLNSAKFGDTTINNDGLTIGTGTTGLEFSTKRVSVGGQKIHDVANGTDDMDAVNVSQLKGVESVANKGWNLSTNGKEATQVKPGDTVDFFGDDNISVANDGTKVKTTLNKDLQGIETIANGPSKVVLNEGYAGIAYGNTSIALMKDNVVLNSKVTVGKDGKISGVAAGRIAADSTDAVNGSQLHAVQQEAGKHTKVVNGSNITVEETDQDGQKTYKVNLNKDLEGIESISNGDAKINLNDTGVVISKGNDKTFSITDTGMGMSVIGDDYVTRSIMVGKTGTVISGGLSVAGSKITNVAAGTEDTDAVNVGQLKQAVSEGNTDSHIKAGEYKVGDDNNVSMDVVDKNGQKIGDVTIKDVAKASDVGDVSNIDKDIQNKDGSKTTVVDAVNNLNDKVGDLNYSNVGKGNIKDGDSSTTAIGKLNQKLSDVEQTAGKHSSVSEGDFNIKVDGSGKNKAGGTDYKVSLNKDLTLDSVKTGDTKMDTNGVKVGENVSLTKDGLTAGDTKVTNAGLSIGDKTYISKDGLNANNQTITNVADGKVEKGSTDAVNGGQLYETNQAIANNATNISSLSHSISNLDNRVNKVGAGAAALAALHPLDFDPDAKWDFAAGYGNYRGTNAAAVGAYYRPNEDTMFSVGGTFGNGENMVNAGVSFKLGSGSSHVSTSRVAMAKEIKELRSELEAMKSAMLDANVGKKIDTSKLQLFPDVPQNHWAYEYVAQLAGNGMIEGYPDGNFAGDRPMTRYEFAAILYRAMMKGAVLSDKILSEFSHELEYFTVDTIAKDKAGNPTIQRVRTVKENINK